MPRQINLSPELESKLMMISQQVGVKEEELIENALIDYLEEWEDIKDAMERLASPPSRYLTLEEVEKELESAVI